MKNETENAMSANERNQRNKLVDIIAAELPGGISEANEQRAKLIATKIVSEYSLTKYPLFSKENHEDSGHTFQATFQHSNNDERGQCHTTTSSSSNPEYGQSGGITHSNIFSVNELNYPLTDREQKIVNAAVKEAKKVAMQEVVSNRGYAYQAVFGVNS